jgi:hypothetical protein
MVYKIRGARALAQRDFAEAFAARDAAMGQNTAKRKKEENEQPVAPPLPLPAGLYSQKSPIQ